MDGIDDPRLIGLDFSKVPIGFPPPGITPNFENPQTIASAIIVIGVVMAVLTVSFVVLRLYSNQHSSRKFALDDCMTPAPGSSRGHARRWTLTVGRYVYHCHNSVLDRHRRRYQL